MKVADLRNKAAAELKHELVELRHELVELRHEQFKLRMQRATGQLANSARFKEIRRDIARIETILNENARAAS